MTIFKSTEIHGTLYREFKFITEENVYITMFSGADKKMLGVGDDGNNMNNESNLVREIIYEVRKVLVKIILIIADAVKM
jgi:hypothetical protein